MPWVARTKARAVARVARGRGGADTAPGASTALLSSVFTREYSKDSLEGTKAGRAVPLLLLLLVRVEVKGGCKASSSLRVGLLSAAHTAGTRGEMAAWARGEAAAAARCSAVAEAAAATPPTGAGATLALLAPPASLSSTRGEGSTPPSGLLCCCRSLASACSLPSSCTSGSLARAAAKASPALARGAAPARQPTPMQLSARATERNSSSAGAKVALATVSAGATNTLGGALSTAA